MPQELSESHSPSRTEPPAPENDAATVCSFVLASMVLTGAAMMLPSNNTNNIQNFANFIFSAILLSSLYIERELVVLNILPVFIVLAWTCVNMLIPYCK